jgi:DNA ligase-associated metallophosphoesterase
MTDHVFSWAGCTFVACASGALWWPERRLLCVSDLHLGRAERLARRGGPLLPPYETTETIDRLAAAVARHAPETVICLGDSFDDGHCEAALPPPQRARLSALVAGRDWVWIAGNHDPGPVAIGGRQGEALALGGIELRHAPRTGCAKPAIVGHLHPMFRRPVGGQMVARPCFLYDATRLILPAFGTFTGGLRAEEAAEAAGLEPAATIAVLTGQRAVALPLAAPARGFRPGRLAS